MSWETDLPVIVPVDFSGMSSSAISTALRLAASPDLVHVVHVIPHLDHIAPEGEVAWQIPSDEERRDIVEKHFSDFLKAHGFENLKQVILDGRPGTEIAEYAKKKNAGVIVISSHGYHGLKRLLLGSVAESVIRHAHCPVFVLRRPDAE